MKKIQVKAAPRAELRIKQRKAFYRRIELICDKLAGKGYFSLFHEQHLRIMFHQRYKPVTVVGENGRTLTPDEQTEHRKILISLFSKQFVETPTGERMEFTRFLTDGVLLIHYVEFQLPFAPFRGSSSLIRAFSPCFTGSVWYKHWEDKALEIMGTSCLFFNDFYRGAVRCSAEGMAIVNPGEKNQLKVYRLPPQTCLQDVNGKKRVLSRVGQLDPLILKRINWLYVAPAQLGFGDMEEQTPRPVYIQQHVINRFEERTSFPGGYVQAYLSAVFSGGSQRYVRQQDSSLLECRFGNHKVGYFLITAHEEKWVVRTFLFLTNDGTPEGRYLATLSRLQRADKEFLMIDRIDAFFTYNISANDELRKLFVKAGCGSLLRYADEVAPSFDRSLQNPEPIYRYLAGISGIAGALRKG